MKRLAVAVVSLMMASAAIGAEKEIEEEPIPLYPLNVNVVSESFEPKIISAWMESMALDEVKKRVYIIRKTEYFINCKDKTLVIKSFYKYDSNNKIIDSYVDESIRKPVSYARGYRSLPPSSVGEIFLNRSCGIMNGTYQNPDGYKGFLD